jgi:hypothetical protein
MPPRFANRLASAPDFSFIPDGDQHSATWLL